MSECAAPFFSVIIPAFNAEGYIARAMESVLSQKGSSYELIVVDDGSADGTAAAVEKLESGCQVDVRLIRQPNAGPGAARNAGIADACGAYILFLDADDCLMESALGLLEAFLVTEAKPDVAAFDFVPRCDGVAVAREKVVSRVYPRAQRLSSADFLKAVYLRHFGYFSWAFAYRTDFLKTRDLSYPVDGRLLEDAVFLNRVIRATETISLYQGDPLYSYTLRQDSISYTANSSTIEWAYRALMGIYEQAKAGGLGEECATGSLPTLLYLRRLAKGSGDARLLREIEKGARYINTHIPLSEKWSKDQIRMVLMRLGILDAVESAAKKLKGGC